MKITFGRSTLTINALPSGSSGMAVSTLLSILQIDVQLPLIKSQSVVRFSGLVELGPPEQSFSRSLRLCEIPFPQSAASLAKTLSSPREFPRSRSHRHSHPLFALFASLRDSFPSVSSFSRQDAEIAKGNSV